MLLEALVACAGVTLSAVATALEIPIRAGKVHAEGDLDFRGTLGVAKDAPVGFKDIRLRFELDTDATGRPARDAAEADRALLRGLSDAAERARDRGASRHCRSAHRRSSAGKVDEPGGQRPVGPGAVVDLVQLFRDAYFEAQPIAKHCRRRGARSRGLLSSA